MYISMASDCGSSHFPLQLIQHLCFSFINIFIILWRHYWNTGATFSSITYERYSQTTFHVILYVSSWLSETYARMRPCVYSYASMTLVHEDGLNSSASKQNCLVPTSEQIGYAEPESVWSSMFHSKQEVKAQKVHANWETRKLLFRLAQQMGISVSSARIATKGCIYM